MTEPRVYLLLGPEAGEKAAFIDSLKSTIAERCGEPPEEYVYYPFETSIGEVIALLRNGSLFARHRLVSYRDAHEIKRKEEVSLLLDYLESPASDTTLLLVTDETQVDKRLAKALPEGASKIFWEMFENRKRGWIASYFAHEGLTISPEATELLLDLVENNTRDMRLECERLVLFFGKGKKLEVGDVETYIYHSREENVFTLFDRIADADFPASLSTLNAILLSGEGNGVQLIAGLLWQFRRLLSAKSLLASRFGQDEVWSKLGIRSKRSQRSYAAGLSNYTLDDLRRIIVLVAHYDARLRTVRADLQPLLLELFLYYCIVRKGFEAEPYRA